MWPSKILLGACALVAAAQVSAANSIHAIAPYRYHGTWVFDDPGVGLVREPFVAGADVMIDKATARIADAADGFVMLFSSSPFPGHQLRLEWRRNDGAGDWYFSPELGMEGWLCPALLKYFERAPRQIFVQVKPRRP
ncbi:MAG TPA: DUF6717 family protein [Usitatibacter sp.]|nr:DUF6717 family protein [Usitatibacter sp.]